MELELVVRRRLTCVRIDANGRTEIFVTRKELAARVNRLQGECSDSSSLLKPLTARDLRKIDPDGLINEPAVSVRQGCILLCLVQLHAMPPLFPCGVTTRALA